MTDATEQTAEKVITAHAASTDELIKLAVAEYPQMDGDLLARVIPACIDVIYRVRDKGGNMHDAGAAAAILALSVASQEGSEQEFEGGRKAFARELEGLLWPERFPPGHERHDPDHVYWNSGPVEGPPYAPFEWSADTIEWVAQEVEAELAGES